MKSIYTFIILSITLLFISCKSDNGAPEAATFEVQQFVTDITTSQILPKVATFKSSVDALDTSIQNFVNTPNASNLTTAQEAWKVAATAYAGIYAFNIGLPKERFMHEQLFNWPAFSVAIENTLATSDPIDATQLSTKAKGLTAIEYLLFIDRNSTNTAILNAFTTTPQRINYLTAVTQELKVQAERLVTLWNSNGEDYATTLSTNTASGLQGSVNLLFNGLFNVVETAKKAKLGKPAGLENTSSTNAETLEAFRSQVSLALLTENMKSVQAIYFNPNGLGIADYVKFMTKNDEINNRIQTQFDRITEASAAIQSPLHTAIDTEKEAVENLYTPIQTLAALLRTDVSSTLSIVITPTDNDGD